METANPTLAPVAQPELHVARTLDDAALYLEHYGWCQGDMYVPVNSTLPMACALGAINMVTFHAPITGLEAVARDDSTGVHVRLVISEFADYLDDGIWRDDDGPAEVVWKFNDHDATTAERVIRAFRAAGERYRVMWDA